MSESNHTFSWPPLWTWVSLRFGVHTGGTFHSTLHRRGELGDCMLIAIDWKVAPAWWTISKANGVRRRFCCVGDEISRDYRTGNCYHLRSQWALNSSLLSYRNWQTQFAWSVAQTAASLLLDVARAKVLTRQGTTELLSTIRLCLLPENSPSDCLLLRAPKLWKREKKRETWEKNTITPRKKLEARKWRGKISSIFDSQMTEFSTSGTDCLAHGDVVNPDGLFCWLTPIHIREKSVQFEAILEPTDIFCALCSFAPF